MIPFLILAALGLGLAITAAGGDYARAARAAAEAHAAADARLASANAASAAASQQIMAAITAWQAALAQAMIPASTSPAPTPTGPAPAPTPGPPLTPPASAMQATDAYAGAAQVAADAAVDHAVAAQDHNQMAAQSTADMAKSAKTPDERAAAAASAAKVIAREKAIAAALAGGQCGVTTYAGITPQVKDTLLAKLHAAGMSVTGDNPSGPWNIDTHQYTVRLRAAWRSSDGVLKLIVTTGKGAKTEHTVLHPTVTCEDIWDEIDPIIAQAGGRKVTSG